MQKIFEKNATLKELPELAKTVAVHLKNTKPFYLAFQGEMGAGKTTFSRYLLYAMGLDSNMPVTSPTFAYLNQYNVGSSVYFHIDMYRADTCPFRTSDELFGGLIPRGAIVEWPEKAKQLIDYTHELRVEILDEKTRKFELFIC